MSNLETYSYNLYGFVAYCIYLVIYKSIFIGKKGSTSLMSNGWLFWVCINRKDIFKTQCIILIMFFIKSLVMCTDIGYHITPQADFCSGRPCRCFSQFQAQYYVTSIYSSSRGGLICCKITMYMSKTAIHCTKLILRYSL